VTVSYTPRQEGLCEAALELIFHDHRRDVDFVITRTLSGWAKRRISGQEHRQNGSARVLRPQPTNDWGDDGASVSTEEEEEFLDSDETGVNVLPVGDDGPDLDFGIVERKRPNGPFATPSNSITIKLADGFSAVTFLNERIKTLDGSEPGCVQALIYFFLLIYCCPSFIATFDGDSRTIQPGTESTVRIMFSPKFDGLFKATLELVFYSGERSARFVVRRSLRGIAGSIKDHKLFESLEQEDKKESTTNHRYVPPQTVILLSQPDKRRKSRKLPNYDIPQSVQELVGDFNTSRPYDERAPVLLYELRPSSLTMDTYAQYFNALLNVEDGHLQYVP